MADHPLLNIGDLPVEIQLSQPEKSKPLSAFDLASIEKLHIRRVLNYTKGNKPEAAKLLNIGLTTIYRKMETYGLS